MTQGDRRQLSLRVDGLKFMAELWKSKYLDLRARSSIPIPICHDLGRYLFRDRFLAF